MFLFFCQPNIFSSFPQTRPFYFSKYFPHLCFFPPLQEFSSRNIFLLFLLCFTPPQTKYFPFSFSFQNIFLLFLLLSKPMFSLSKFSILFHFSSPPKINHFPRNKNQILRRIHIVYSVYFFNFAFCLRLSAFRLL